MVIKIALAGNPNCGKITLFNALTGSNQFVGNWPEVTVEKKEGKLKNHKDVIVTDLPGIYSLSPYTLEEVVARNYLVSERPDVILNVIDGTNLERNLYLTTQLLELGIPVVVAINMMDVVNKRGDKINIAQLAKKLGCRVCEISALKGSGIDQAAELAVKAAESSEPIIPQHSFSGAVEHAIAHIEEAFLHDVPEEQQRWYAIKIFERDEKVLQQLDIPKQVKAHIEKDICLAEKELDDDSESIITNERNIYIASITDDCIKKKNLGGLTTSDKIDRVVTNRWLALPIFALIMFAVYYVSVQTVGDWATGWANDGLFGDGWQIWNNIAAEFTQLTAFSFLVFNLLCVPCFAAMGVNKREMNSAKWTAFAITYQCVFAYAVSLCIYQFGLLFTGFVQPVGLIAAVLIVAFVIFMMIRPYKESETLDIKVKA